MVETAVWPISILINVLLKDLSFNFYLLLLQLVLCLMAALKKVQVGKDQYIIHSTGHILRSARIF